MSMPRLSTYVNWVPLLLRTVTFGSCSGFLYGSVVAPATSRLGETSAARQRRVNDQLGSTRA